MSLDDTCPSIETNSTPFCKPAKRATRASAIFLPSSDFDDDCDVTQVLDNTPVIEAEETPFRRPARKAVRRSEVCNDDCDVTQMMDVTLEMDDTPVCELTKRTTRTSKNLLPLMHLFMPDFAAKEERATFSGMEPPPCGASARSRSSRAQNQHEQLRSQLDEMAKVITMKDKVIFEKDQEIASLKEQLERVAACDDQKVKGESQTHLNQRRRMRPGMSSVELEEHKKKPAHQHKLQLKESLEENVKKCTCQTGCRTKRCGCVKINQACTDSCLCASQCKNRQ